MSKIPQRVKEPSSYAKIFAKHKANQTRKDESTDDLQTSAESAPHEGPSGSYVDPEGSQGMSRSYGTNHFHG